MRKLFIAEFISFFYPAAFFFGLRYQPNFVNMESLTTKFGKCLECDAVLKGRADKKFCDSHCRNAFHNLRNKMRALEFSSVQGILSDNRSILEKLIGNGERVVGRHRLLSEGFNFHLFTCFYRGEKGKQYYFCYDLGYMTVENHYFVLIRSGLTSERKSK